MGRGLALRLAQAGATVAFTFREATGSAEETVQILAKAGVEAIALPCDVRKPAEVQEAVDRAVQGMGGLDLLINNAGAFETVPLEQISVEQWDAMFETNTRGPFLVAQAAYAALKTAKGRIINIGSLGGMRPWATHGHYCASKAALHMLSQTMAKAWAPEISVNCIAPGMIVHGETVEESYRYFAEKTPMQRNGSIEEIAAAMMFFATGPHFITGQLLAVDGGLGL